MISPFESQQVRYDQQGKRVISYGTTSYGYDIRVGNKFKLFSNIRAGVVDPKNFDPEFLVDVEGDCIIPPNSYALAHSLEYMRIPRSVLVLCVGKSTYARCGIIVNVTPLEPEWEGQITLEISNSTPNPVKVYANEGIAQLLFLEGGNCLTSYADRSGKYMGQDGITLARS